MTIIAIHTINALGALCREYHQQRPMSEIKIRFMLAQLTQVKLEGLIKVINDVFNELEANLFIVFMKKMYFYEHLMQSVLTMFKGG